MFLIFQRTHNDLRKLDSNYVAWSKYRDNEKTPKMTLKMSFFKISKNKKMRFFLMSQGSFSPKIRFLGQKVCSVARSQTDRQTDRHESEYRGHPFRVSGIFPSTYHQGSVQYSQFYFESVSVTEQKIKRQAQRRAAADRSRHKSHGRIQYQGTYFLT